MQPLDHIVLVIPERMEPDFNMHNVNEIFFNDYCLVDTVISTKLLKIYRMSINPSPH